MPAENFGTVHLDGTHADHPARARPPAPAAIPILPYVTHSWHALRVRILRPFRRSLASILLSLFLLSPNLPPLAFTRRSDVFARRLVAALPTSFISSRLVQWRSPSSLPSFGAKNFGGRQVLGVCESCAVAAEALTETETRRCREYRV